MLKNRLEQFKKRQREDAAKIQAEMADAVSAEAGVAAAAAAPFGGDMHAEVDVADTADIHEDEEDYVEDYEPEMSPEPADPRTMHFDDRRLPIVNEEEILRQLVSLHLTTFARHFRLFHSAIQPFSPSFVY